jgi:hypothetical protein
MLVKWLKKDPQEPSVFDDPLPLWQRLNPGMSWREVRDFHLSRRAVLPAKAVTRIRPSN